MVEIVLGPKSNYHQGTLDHGFNISKLNFSHFHKRTSDNNDLLSLQDKRAKQVEGLEKCHVQMLQ